MRIAWESQGEGAAVILVQGLGYGRWGWDPVVPGLAERFRVLTFDNRGIGESDKPAGPYTAREMAGDVVQVLDEAEIERAHVVGASLGGMIAQEVAVAAPERVDRLVLCCTTPGGAGAVPMPEVTVQLFRDAASLEPLDALRRFVVNALGPEASEPLVEEIYRRRVENPPDPAGWQGQAAAGTTFPGVDGTIAAPTLVLHGTADNVVAVGNAQLLGGRVELFEGAGHLFFWEQPERFVRIVTEFLS